VQSVECSNVGKLTRAALIIEKMQRGLLWSGATFEHSALVATLDTYDVVNI
jgi:hypothetical protein